jgi:hypothetical protein
MLFNNAILANVYFKEVWTSNTTQLCIDLNWTFKTFLENINDSISRQFNIEPNNFEVIKIGQPGVSEEGTAITSCDIKLKRVFNNSSNIAFYIRRKNFDYSRIRLGLPEEDEEASILDTRCVVCLDTNTTTYFGCIHTICSVCIQGCLNVNHNRCPLCRQNLRR